MTASMITSFTARPAAGTGGEYWLHIEQVLPDDNTATLGEVANILDSLYGIDPCNEYGELTPITIDNASADNYPAGEDEEDDGSDQAAMMRFFDDVVSGAFTLDLCKANANGDYQAQIKVAIPHQGEPYALRLDNGTIDKTTVINETFTKTFTIDNASSLDLDFPVIGGESFSWAGSVAGQNGYKSGPDIYRSGRTLSWGEPVSGTLHVSYQTRYDLVDITVNGTAEGEIGECRALCFYHGLLDDITLEKPEIDDDATEIDRWRFCSGGSYAGTPSDDIVTCYETVTYNYICECSGTPAHSVTEDVIVPCPSSMRRCNLGLGSDTHKEADGKWHCSSYMGSRTQFADFVSCPERLYNNQTGQWADTGENSILADPDYYEQRCCHAPNGSLPNCQVKYEKNTGGSEIDPAKLADYQARYSDRLELIAVSPDDGDCGYIKTTIGDEASNCCDGVEPIAWDAEFSAEILADNSTGIIRVTGGRPPFTVSVRGNGFFLDHARTIRDGIVQSNVFNLYTGQACGACRVTVADGCGIMTGYVLSVNGQWYRDYKSEAGVNGDDLGVPPYSDGCPKIFEGIGRVSLTTGADYSEESDMAAGYKVEQIFSTNKSLVAAKDTYEKALAVCENYQPDPAYQTPKRLQGSCFDFADAPLYRPCGQNSDLPMGGSFQLGKSSRVTTSFWYTASVRYSIVQQTTIYKWIC